MRAWSLGLAYCSICKRQMSIFLLNFANARVSLTSYFQTGTAGGRPLFHLTPGWGPFLEFHEAAGDEVDSLLGA